MAVAFQLGLGLVGLYTALLVDGLQGHHEAAWETRLP